jgi:predicted GIY-YIG superfamily endonuclease
MSNTISEEDLTIKNLTAKYYVYSLRAENEHMPFYIGITAVNRRRFNEHMCRANKGDSKLVYTKIRKCINENVRIIHEVLLTSESQSVALEMEKFLIQSYGRQDIKTGILKNHTAGGDGVHEYRHTEKAREKMKLAKLGNKLNVGRKRPDVVEKWSKPISMFNHKGELVNTFNSAREAWKETGIHFGGISAVLSGKNKRVKQKPTGDYFVFRFREESCTSIEPFKNQKSGRSPKQ